MEKATFNKFRRIVYEKSGITLHDGKEALVTARVGKRMRALGIDDHKKYLEHVLNDDSGNEVIQLLDVISTNVTSFYREPQHFEFLAEQVKKMVSSGRSKIRIWCAASSSGEEPYSIAMTFLENCGDWRGDFRILATDISTRILKAATEGSYSYIKVEKVPPRLLDKYFEKIETDKGNQYAAKSSLKGLIKYARLNLAKPPFPMSGPFDMVFCRNVMIYFDNEIRRKLLDEVFRLLKPGGYLIVGHAESLTGMLCNLKSIRPSIYIK
jgi:chemotaxis protein methyltransferase CheR